MSIIGWLILGLIAGWIASKVVNKSGQGIILDIVAHVAGTLAAHGEKLSAGDVIITGSIVPPPLIGPDETGFAYRLDPLPQLSVQFSRGA